MSKPDKIEHVNARASVWTRRLACAALLLLFQLSETREAAALLPAPTLSSPANGATGVSTAPTFSWSSVTGANRYWLTVATSSSTLPTDPNAISCPGCVISCSITTTSHTAGTSCTTGQSQALSQNTTYYWRVQAWNTNGTQGSYSSIRSFSTAASLLPAPTLSSPANGATGVSTTPAFSWSSVTGANRYWLTVATSSSTLPTDPNTISCPGCVISCSITTTSHTAGTSCTTGQSQALNQNTTYYWRVQGWNTNGTQGNYSSIRSFSTAASLLPAPTLSSPANGATGVSTTPTFSWSSVTGANRYWLTVATSSSTLPTDPNTISCPGCVISCSITTTSHTAGTSCTTGQSQALSQNTTYYWRVQAWNTNGTQGNYSSIRSFSTAASLLPAPTLSSPANGATGVSTTPAFSWSSVTGANRYWLTVAASSSTLPTDPNTISCPGCVISCSITTTSHTAGTSCTTGQSQALSQNTTYYWRVQAWNTNGTQGNYSSIWNLTTQGGGTPDVRIVPPSLTFSANSVATVEAPVEAPQPATELPEVVTNEVEVDLGRHARFSAARNLEAQADGLRLAEGFTEGAAESLPISAPAPFSYLGAKWGAAIADGTLKISVRYSKDGTDWSRWTEIVADEHLSEPSSAFFLAKLMRVEKDTRVIQFSVHMEARPGSPPPVLKSLAFIFLDPGETPSWLLEQLQATPEPPLLSRTQWGCPHGQDSPLWPPAYTTVTHLIVHHTETSNSAADWPAEVRSIWSYHTNTRGWGDIGYNYLIDPSGVIYEGRAGGANAIGAHFSCQNSRTQGITLLGSYSAATPTTPALQSLKALLAWIASREGLDPLATSFHSGTQLNLKAISGHRDGNTSPHVCNSTACPGNTLYALLPGIRNDVAALMSGTDGQTFTIYNDGTGTLSVSSMQLQNPGSWIQWTPHAPFDVAPGSSRQVTVTVDFSAAPAGSSTRRLLVSSNDPDENPYPGAVDITVNRPSSACHGLTRTHTGSGSDPSASPPNSGGCPTGQYAAGASIQVTATPSAGWTVGRWTGTVDDGSTLTTNTVIMPASGHTVAVDYVQAPAVCYVLSGTHTGSGGDPLASPPSSDGCPAGQYAAGASIQVTASPAAGWTVAGWSGTVADASTSTTNMISMPADNHLVTVNYVEELPTCYLLTRAHTGSGGDPSAWPASSGGCPANRYTSGSLIELTASPASGWAVDGWIGTDDDGSTSTTNTVTMPQGDHTITVNYAEAESGAGTDFYTVTPCRIIDTRGFGPLESGAIYEISVTGYCGVPATAAAVAVNVTAAAPAGDGYLTFWPAQSSMPGTSTVNFSPARTRANNAILVLAPGYFGAEGAVWVRPNVGGGATVHLLLDVMGYFQ